MWGRLRNRDPGDYRSAYNDRSGSDHDCGTDNHRRTNHHDCGTDNHRRTNHHDCGTRRIQ